MGNKSQLRYSVRARATGSYSRLSLNARLRSPVPAAQDRARNRF
jgi:hypothetical protein